MSKRADLLTLVRAVPIGRVTTFDVLAQKIGEPLALVQSLIAHLSEDEREFVPWHRVVAKGGAIGRGPHRDQQFARLVREGSLKQYLREIEEDEKAEPKADKSDD